MKKINMLVVVGALLVSTSSFAATIVCSGKAEGGSIQIQNLTITPQKIDLKYSVDGGASISRSYIVTEYFIKNGTTDLHKQAYFIGGSKSGAKNDYEDIALPAYGQYKSGVGSHIAFNHGGNRVFGVVGCK